MGEHRRFKGVSDTTQNVCHLRSHITQQKTKSKGHGTLKKQTHRHVLQWRTLCGIRNGNLFSCLAIPRYAVKIARQVKPNKGTGIQNTRERWRLLGNPFQNIKLSPSDLGKLIKRLAVCPYILLLNLRDHQQRCSNSANSCYTKTQIRSVYLPWVIGVHWDSPKIRVGFQWELNRGSFTPPPLPLAQPLSPLPLARYKIP